MDYTLAKKLKDAGFPQNISGSFYLEDESLAPVHNMMSASPTWVYIPILSELIEACGEPFVLVLELAGQWYAQNSPQKFYGATPEEAVANLWLSLHPTNIE